MIKSSRLFYAGIAVICIALLSYGYYLQYVDGLEPCPMCIFQRICYAAIVVVAAVAALHNGKRIANIGYSVFLTVIALIGAGIAGRQTWLQHLPADQVPECGPDLAFMLEMYPLGETILQTLRGSGDCATVDWRFIGLSIAEWSLICFVAIALTLLIQIVTDKSPAT